jgi:tetratricopeptide (TPR) repeat protein
LDDEFAATVRDLLVSEPGTRERAARLGAIELRQMARAEARFAARSVEGGMAALTGALTLVHTAEATPALFGPRSVAALADGARAFAQRGDEGRSRALYNVLLPMATSAERADIEHHLTAIDSWVKALRSDGGPTAAAGVVERIEVRRRMLEPSQAAMDSAVRATTAWVKEALALRELFRKTRAAPSHDDGVEAWRAIETGPVVLVSLYLRDGDIVGALSAARREPFLSLLESGRSQFSMTLAAAGRDATSAACITLLRHFRSLTGGDANDDNDAFADDRDLFAMATFGIAGECYRRDPSAPAAALTLGRALEELGMAEAAPAVLVPSVQAHPDPHFVGESLDISLHALLGEQELGDVDGARRTFRAAQPLLAVASQPALRGKVRPSSARLRAAMGNIELREGRPDLAQDLLTRSADEEKSADVLLSLANIEARGHRARAALEHIAGALGLADSMRDSALRSEILLAKSDVLREEGQEAPARDALAEALRTLAEARTRLSGSALARVERVLACVLDRFGASGPAERAVERAYAAAPAEKTQVSRTVGALLGRALVRGDLPAAREWLRLAVGVDAEDGDLVHYALWTRILERQRHVVSDGAPDRVFAAVPDDRRWASLLARYGEGKLNLDELLARAATPEHKSEGFFYEAMERRANGDASGEKDLLRHLLARAGLSETLELVVRGLLDRGVSWADAPLPPDVAIP